MDQTATDTTSTPAASPQEGHVIIAGFGIVGRAVAELLDHQKTPYCVVELNPSTCDRVGRYGVRIINGDIRQKEVMLQAGIEHAAALAVAMPDEHVALETVKLAHELVPGLTIIARCTFSSAGMQATLLGASEVVVAEQVVAREFAGALKRKLG